jgi:lysozyme family protein
MTFDHALTHVGIMEGKFSMDAFDRGNWTEGKRGQGVLKGTKYGISAAAYPHLDIRKLTWEQARIIYLADYWEKYRLDEIAEQLRLPFFDALVNHGGFAVKLLQRAVGADDDGAIGPITIGKTYLSGSTPWKFALVRSDYYAEIVQNGINDANDIKQLKGWLRRNIKVLQETIQYFHDR